MSYLCMPSHKKTVFFFKYYLEAISIGNERVLLFSLTAIFFSFFHYNYFISLAVHNFIQAIVGAEIWSFWIKNKYWCAGEKCFP